jgi:hypothetical protein
VGVGLIWAISFLESGGFHHSRSSRSSGVDASEHRAAQNLLAI